MGNGLNRSGLGGGWSVTPRPVFDLLFRVVLVALIFAAYKPSLTHPPRADQWCYLFDTMDRHELADVLDYSYSYNRTRQTAAGDTDLFRPILFTILALEKCLLEGDLRNTQMIGVVFHCVICLLFLSFLRWVEMVVRGQQQQTESPSTRPDRNRSFMPYALTLFFALNPAIQDLVIWAHLQGYLLFLIFALSSINLLMSHLSGPSAGRGLSPSLCGAWVFAFLSAFTYELGQIYSVLAGCYLAAASCRRVGFPRSAVMLFAFASVLPIYQAVNRYDMKVHAGQFGPDNLLGQICEELPTRQTLDHSKRYFVYTGVQPFCAPFLRAACHGGRMEVSESLLADPPLMRWGHMGRVSALIVVVTFGFALFGLAGLIRGGQTQALLLVTFLAGLCVTYAALNVLGRMNLRHEPSILSTNSYYTYISLLFMLMTLFTMWQGADKTSGLVKSGLWAFLITGLVALALYGGSQVRSRNRAFADEMKPVSSPIRAVQKFVRKHKHEPDFSIEIDHESSDFVGRKYDLWDTDIIFGRWLRPDAKYLIAIRQRSVVILSIRATSGTGPSD